MSSATAAVSAAFPRCFALTSVTNINLRRRQPRGSRRLHRQLHRSYQFAHRLHEIGDWAFVSSTMRSRYHHNRSAKRATCLPGPALRCRSRRRSANRLRHGDCSPVPRYRTRARCARRHSGHRDIVDEAARRAHHLARALDRRGRRQQKNQVETFARAGVFNSPASSAEDRQPATHRFLRTRNQHKPLTAVVEID